MTYEVPDQSGKLAIVTGANSGTGKEAARKLAGAGATVIMAVRSAAKGEQAKKDILTDHPGAEVQVRRLDLADQASVQEFAEQMIADVRPVDLLLNNAGVMMLPARHETVDGFEMQLGTNFFGPFALTVRLLPALLKAKAPRVVTMSSNNQGPIDFDNLNWESGYNPIGAYARSSSPTCCSASNSPESQPSEAGTCCPWAHIRATPRPASSRTAPNSAVDSRWHCASPRPSPRDTPPRPAPTRCCTPPPLRTWPRAGTTAPASA